jgi:hypothetical protein
MKLTNFAATYLTASVPEQIIKKMADQLSDELKQFVLDAVDEMHSNCNDRQALYNIGQKIGAQEPWYPGEGIRFLQICYYAYISKYGRDGQISEGMWSGINGWRS